MAAYALTRRAALAASLAALSAQSRSTWAADTIPVKVQGFGASVTVLPEMYARALGLFEQQGLATEYLPPVYNANAVMQALVQGSADIASTGGSAIIQAVQQGRRVKCVAAGMVGLELKVLLTKPGQEKIAKAGIGFGAPQLDRIRALRGLRLAAPGTGSTSDTAFRYGLKRAGIDPARDVTIQPMSDAASILAAARAGAVDALVGVSTGANAVAEAEGTVRRFIAFEDDDPIMQNYPTTIYAVSDQYLQKNAATVATFLKAMLAAKQAVRRGLTDAELATMKQKFFPDMADGVWASSHRMAQPMFKAALAPTRAQFDALLTINNAQADVPATVTFEQCFDPALATEIDKG